MERARVGGAVAEERDADARLLAELEGERGADDRGEAAADDGVRAEVSLARRRRGASSRRSRSEQPSCLPYSSAMTALTCVPFAIVWPCARCVEAITSSGSSAAQTPDATASWPIATCRKPGSSPARKRSSTFSSKRRISSISRKSSRSRSSESAPSSPVACPRPSPSGLIMLTPAWGSSSSGVGSASELRRTGASASSNGRRAAGRAALPRGSAARPCEAPAGSATSCASRCAAPAAGSAPDQADKLFGKLDDERIRGTAALVTVDERAGARGGAARPLAALWDAALASVPAGLERPALRARADLERPPRARGAPAGAAQPDARAGSQRLPLPRRAERSATAPRRRWRAAASSALDAEGIPGRLTLLHVLSDTHNVATQGPVWRVAGKAV